MIIDIVHNLNLDIFCHVPACRKTYCVEFKIVFVLGYWERLPVVNTYTPKNTKDINPKCELVLVAMTCLSIEHLA
jgi:hypothetical protein